MTQLKGNNSYIACRQREDAIKSLQKFNASSIKIIIPSLIIIICCVTLILGIGVTTASMISNVSLIDLIQDHHKPVLSNSFHLIYGVNDDNKGRIDGNLEQTIKSAESGTIVQAIAEDGYVFVGWSDGYENATRIDENVKKDIFVNAIFIIIEDNEEQDETLEEQQETNPNGSSSSNSTDSNNQKNPTNGNGNGQGDGAGANSDSASNQIIDGSTYYGDEYGNSLSEAQNGVSSNNNLSSGEKDIIGDYFHNIQK